MPTTPDQAHLNLAYARIQRLRSELTTRASEILSNHDNDDPQSILQRDQEHFALQDRIDQLDAAEDNMIFGRIDVAESLIADAEFPLYYGELLADRRYIGKLGVMDEELHSLVLDWRAPLARPFYTATTLTPENVINRAHIKTSLGKIQSVHSELLISADAEVQNSLVTGETALLSAINQKRDVHMQDIVHTIAAEQDQIIRDDSQGVVVVEGGPGTGKTAVALHRAAYLLYTWREKLSKEGVLIIGPNSQFLSYISQVLPSLGENGVVLSTIGNLYPGISSADTSDLEENQVTQEVKGSSEMVTILQNAVALYRPIPQDSIEISHQNITLQITPEMVSTAQDRTFSRTQQHNPGKNIFVSELTFLLRDQLAQTIGQDPYTGEMLLPAEDIEDLQKDLSEDSTVQGTIEELWPLLTPETVLVDFLSSPERIQQAAYEYDTDTQNALFRPDGYAWSDTDAPLLDELAEILGNISTGALTEEEQKSIDDAQRALDVLEGSSSQDLDDDFESEIVMAYDLLDAEGFAQRHKHIQRLSVAARAQADRKWAYGHVIVDEAQEISAMGWRMIFRRIPSKWMTIVGDPAQTGSPAGIDSWEETLQPYIQDRWTHYTLSVNYRTPADITARAEEELSKAGIAYTDNIALRKTGSGIQEFSYSTAEELYQHIAHAIACELSSVSRRTPPTEYSYPEESHGTESSKVPMIGIILPDTNPLSTTITDTSSGEAQKIMREQIAGALKDSYISYPDEKIFIGTTAHSKGLEFDHTIVVSPETIREESPQGTQNLYVALTRATQGLTILSKD